MSACPARIRVDGLVSRQRALRITQAYPNCRLTAAQIDLVGEVDPYARHLSELDQRFLVP